MSATITLILGPAGSGKTRRLLDVYRAAAAGAPPGRALWLTPTRRAADEIRPHLPAGLLPHALPLADFADEMVRAYHPTDRPLSLVRQRLLVEELLADLAGRDELKYFARVADARGFLDTVIGWLDAWQAHGVRGEDFARAAGSDKERDAARILAEYQRRLDLHHPLDGPA